MERSAVQLHQADVLLRKWIIKPWQTFSHRCYTFGRSLSDYIRLDVTCLRATLEKAMAQLKAAVDAL